MGLCFKFLNKSLPIFPKEQKLMKVKAPFIGETSGLPTIKILDGSTYSILL